MLHRHAAARRAHGGRDAESQQLGSTGQGVTKDSIKVGIALVDYTAIKDFVDYNHGDQKPVAQSYVDYINKNGGIDGRKIVPVYKEYPPIPGGKPDPLSLCTSWAEDDKVFAVLGVFIDFTGQGQLCLTKEHQVVHIGHELDQPWIDAAPGGLLLTPDQTKEQAAAVVVNLLASTGKLKGKTVAVIGDKNSESRVNDVIVPALKKARSEDGFDRDRDHHRHGHRRPPRRSSTASSRSGRARSVDTVFLAGQQRLRQAVRGDDQVLAPEGAARHRHRHHAGAGS